MNNDNTEKHLVIAAIATAAAPITLTTITIVVIALPHWGQAKAIGLRVVTITTITLTTIIGLPITRILSQTAITSIAAIASISSVAQYVCGGIISISGARIVSISAAWIIVAATYCTRVVTAAAAIVVRIIT